MDIKILGPGCRKCKEAEELVREAVAEAGVEAEITKVSDMMEIASFGVMGTPAVIIDGEVKCVGKVPKKQEVLDWLK